MPPFSTIPYGPAPSYAYPIVEIGAYLLFILCFIHAAKKGVGDVAYLVGGMLFGLLLEYVNVVNNLGYVYGRFTIMFGTAPKDIPLCIGVGWGMIMYTARLFSDSLKMNLWASVALDTLLAISIDLSMDTVAYRLHMWHWNWAGTGLDPLKADWFGIPYGNFFGWVCVVFFYASASRLFQKWFASGSRNAAVFSALAPLLAIIVSQILLYVTLVYINGFLKQQFGITSRHRFISALIMLSVLLIGGLRKSKIQFVPLPYISWLVPAFFHTYFFIFLFTQNFYKEHILMVVVPVVLMMISIVLHLLPLVKSRKKESDRIVSEQPA
jgi:uncharacterized membrane protein